MYVGNWIRVLVFYSYLFDGVKNRWFNVILYFIGVELYYIEFVVISVKYDSYLLNVFLICMLMVFNFVLYF